MPKATCKPWSHAFVASLAGLPDNADVREMDQQFHVDVLEKDYKAAIPHDPCHCALANAVARQSGLPRAVFPVITSGSVFIPMRAKDGWFLAQYAHTAETRAGLILFDETGRFPEGGFTFGPLPPSSRRAYKIAQSRKRNETRKDRRANHVGTSAAAVKTARVFRPLSGVIQA